MEYVLGIDQSTQGTKAVLFDERADMVARADIGHKQISNEKGWISHDPMEIYDHLIQAVREVVERPASIKEESGRLGSAIRERRSFCGIGRGGPSAMRWYGSVPARPASQSG